MILNTKRLPIFALIPLLVGLTLGPVTVLAASYPEPLKHFKMSEFRDKETGQVYMHLSFLKKLDELRELCGFALYINSGYRSPKHWLEAIKTKSGKHSEGIAVDIHMVTAKQKNILIRHALALGFTGIGIYPLHIHLDTRKGKTVIWVSDHYPAHQARDSVRIK